MSICWFMANCDTSLKDIVINLLSVNSVILVEPFCFYNEIINNDSAYNLIHPNFDNSCNDIFDSSFGDVDASFKDVFFVSPELSSERDYVITHSVCSST